MNDTMHRVLKYFAEQGRQASTWRGVILVITAITGTAVSEEKQAAIALVGLAFAGLVGALVPDTLKKPEASEPPTDNTKGNP